MSTVPIPSLLSLPVEILRRIFESLDTPTLLFSLRSTCRRLKAIVDDYDRYTLDFQSISKSDFQLICRLVDPRKVISLTFSPMEETSDQIEIFTSSFRIRQFNRLRSLTLIGIKENQLKNILKRFYIPSLTSFSCKLRVYDDRRRKTTVTLLSSIIAQANIHHLSLDLRSNRVEQMIWPVQCIIRYLRIGCCVEFDQIFTILRCSPHLQTLVIYDSHDISFKTVPQDLLPASSQQLTSFTIEDLGINIDNLELLLSLMPSLTHLKLIGFGSLMNGNRWEQFIQTNLPFLNQFEVFLEKQNGFGIVSTDIESIITPFRTPFWLEHKKWFFTCEHTDIWPRLIKFYSIPVCVNSLSYEPGPKKTSLSTFNPIANSNVSIMDNVNTIKITASKFTSNDIEQERQTPNDLSFRKVTKLQFYYDIHQLLDWTSFLSTIIDIKVVTQIKLTGIAISQADPGIIAELSKLLQQACSLISLDICSQYGRKSNLTAQDICSMPPPFVKHLAALIKNLHEAEISLGQLQHLSTARFVCVDRKRSYNSFTEWLEQNKTGSSSFVGAGYINIWFRYNNNQLNAVRVGNKRIKLTDEH